MIPELEPVDGKPGALVQRKRGRVPRLRIDEYIVYIMSYEPVERTRD
jgi:hypothetical protein